MKEEHRRLVLLRRALLEYSEGKHKMKEVADTVREFWMLRGKMTRVNIDDTVENYIRNAFDWDQCPLGFTSFAIWAKVDDIYRDYLYRKGITS